MSQLKALIFAFLAISLCSAQNITTITPSLTQTTENSSEELEVLEDITQWISGLIHNEETYHGESGEQTEHTESAEETVFVEEQSMVEDGGSGRISEDFVSHTEEHYGEEEVRIIIEAKEGSFGETEAMIVFSSVGEEVIELESLEEEKLAVIAIDVEKVGIEKGEQEDQKGNVTSVNEVQNPQAVNNITITLQIQGDGNSDIDVDVDVFVNGKEDGEKKGRHNRHQRRGQRGIRDDSDDSDESDNYHFRPQMRN